MSVRVISASAGTGKTHRLTEVLADALLGADERVRPEGVVAITYTRRAAAELASRVRRRLMSAGARLDGEERARAWDVAGRIRDGYLGTVHAVCDRLLREFALEAGMSPHLEPITEGARQKLLREALGDVLGRADAELAVIEDLTRRLRLDKWRERLEQVVARARANGLDADALAESARRSTEGLRALLRDAPEPDPTYLDDLRTTLEQAEAALEIEAERSLQARRRHEMVSALLADVREGRMPPWGAQEYAARELGGTASASAYGLPLAAVVDRHLRHPQFHDDLERAVAIVFDLAARVLRTFEQRKREARVVDYDDMLAETLALLGRDDVADALRERLDLVLVDEFQDTSPMQLAIILRLCELAPEASWVGDPKQAIYSFQGADPDLMQTAMDHVLGSRQPEILDVSWRSRPGLVELSSEVFSRAFLPHGIAPERVRLRAQRADRKELADLPVLDLWKWTVWGKPQWPEAHAIADGVATLIEKQVPVSERPHGGEDGPVRPVKAGDIAVLSRTNKECQRVADALRQRGIPARVRLQQLMAEPEARVACAAIELLADPRSGVAALEIGWISGAASADPDGWLSKRIAEARADQERFADDPRVRALRALAKEATALSPLQAFERAVEAADLVALCLGWPDGERRVANLEAIRAEVRAYEEQCAMQRQACTIAGLAAHLQALAAGETAGDQAMPTDADAVTVLTWHTAKGLEWPVVVLGSLGWTRKGTPFELEVEPADRFDPEAPLAGRWIRFWPYPYGDRQTNTMLAHRALGTPEAARMARRDARERLRLLYVGFTRARDRLCLAVGLQRNERQDVWLREIVDADGQPILDLPWEAPAGNQVAQVAGGLQVPCRVRLLRGERPGRAARAAVRGSRFVRRAPSSALPEVVHPSSVELEGEGVEVLPAVTLAGRVALTTSAIAMDRVGNAVHGFLAADDPRRTAAERLASARAFLEAEEVAHAFEAISLPRIADALRTWVRALPGGDGAIWRTEWPVRWRMPVPASSGGPAGAPRLMVGEIDLVLDLGDGLVVVDHKSFPGGPEDRDRRSREYAGQLAAYRAALESATGKPVLATVLHFPLRGEVQEVRVPKGAFERWLVRSQSVAMPLVGQTDDEWKAWTAPHVGESPGAPHVGETAGAPHVGESPGTPHVGESRGAPHVGETAGAPHVGESPGTPHVGESPGAPHDGETAGAPHVGERDGAPHVRGRGESPGIPHVGASPGVPHVGASPGAPHVGASPGTPHVGETAGAPHVGKTAGAPHVEASPGAPHVGESPGAPHVGESPGSPHVGASPGAPHVGESPGAPHVGESSPPFPEGPPVVAEPAEVVGPFREPPWVAEPAATVSLRIPEPPVPPSAPPPVATEVAWIGEPTLPVFTAPEPLPLVEPPPEPTVPVATIPAYETWEPPPPEPMIEAPRAPVPKDVLPERLPRRRRKEPEPVPVEQLSLFRKP